MPTTQRRNVKGNNGPSNPNLDDDNNDAQLTTTTTTTTNSTTHLESLIHSNANKPRVRPPIKGQHNSNINDTHVKTTKLTTRTMSLWPIITTLLTFRSLSAIFSPFNDCDEVFNYLEPLHTLFYGTGLQTWEYSPEYALRSFTFLILHYPFALISWITGIELTYGKLGTFMLMRILLGVFSCYCQAKLIRSVGLVFGEKSARLFLFLLLFAPGLTHSSHAILPQGFCMNILMLVYCHWLNAITTTTIAPYYHNLATSDIYNRHQRFFAQNNHIATSTAPTPGQIQRLLSNTGTPIQTPPAPSLWHLCIAAIPFMSLPSVLPSNVSSTPTSTPNSATLTKKEKDSNNNTAPDQPSSSSSSSVLIQTNTSTDIQPYQAELQAVRDWSKMITLIAISGLIGWPFTLIFLLPILVSFLDCYMPITHSISARWCQLRERAYYFIFSYLLPISCLQRLFVHGHANHPQWSVDVFFYQIKGVFNSYESHFSTCAPLSTPSPTISTTVLPAPNSSHQTTPNAKRLKVFIFLCCFALAVGAIITAISLLVDGYFYGRWTLSFLNIAFYNSNFKGDSTDSSQGQQLYGTEPPSYYFFNLLLNFNIAVILAVVFLAIAAALNVLIIVLGKYRLTHLLLMIFPVRTDLHASAYLLSPPIPMTSLAMTPSPVSNPDRPESADLFGYDEFNDSAPTTTSTATTTDDSTTTPPPLQSRQRNDSPQRSYYIRHPPLFYRLFATLCRLHQQFLVILPAIIWTLVMLIQPHKEERFLYIIYPALCLAAVFGLEFTVDIIGYAYDFVRCCWKGNSVSDLATLNNSFKDSTNHGLQCACCLADYPRNFIEPVDRNDPAVPKLATGTTGLVGNTKQQPPPQQQQPQPQQQAQPQSIALTIISSIIPASFFSTIRSSVHYLFHIPTSSLTSLRYISHAHPVRKPYRPYSGIVYACVFAMTFLYMFLSVSRNLAVIFGYSAPALTMFKFYANLRGDVPSTPLFATNDQGFISGTNLYRTAITGKHFTTALLHQRSLNEQVELLFDSGANRFSQIIESYQVGTNLTTIERGNEMELVQNRRPKIQNSQVNTFSSHVPKSVRYIHPCFLRQLQEHLYLNAKMKQVMAKAVAGGKDSDFSEDHLYQLYNQHSSGQDVPADVVESLFTSFLRSTTTPNQIKYFPSKIAECLAYHLPLPLLGTNPNLHMSNTTSSNHHITPTPLLNRIPMNVNNALGSQPLNYQLFSLMHATGGYFIPKEPQPESVTQRQVNQGLDPILSPPVAMVPASVIASRFHAKLPPVRPRDPIHKHINSATNQYNEINRDLTPIIPINKHLEPFEMKKIVEESTTLKLCLGNDWFRYPSSFFLPDAIWVRFDALKRIIDDLPNDFVKLNHTTTTTTTTTATDSAHQPNEYTQSLLEFMLKHDKHVLGSGVGTIVGDEILLRPRVEMEYLPDFDFERMLPQHFTSSVSLNPSSYPFSYTYEEVEIKEGDAGNDAAAGTNTPKQKVYKKTVPIFNKQTSQAVPNFNDLNRRDLTRFLPQLDWCDYIYDTDLTVRFSEDGSSLGNDKESSNSTEYDIRKEHLYRKSFELISSLPIIDPERSPSSSRAFYIWGKWSAKNHFLPFNLWARKSQSSTDRP